MSLEPLSTWRSTYKNEIVPTNNPASGVAALAAWANARTTGLLQLSGITGPGMVFTFNSAVWVTALLALPTTPIAEIGATNFANSWVTAISASLAVTAPGTIVGTPSPLTTFSSVTTTVIDGSGITAGFNKLVELKDVEPSSDPDDVPLVDYLRQAFLLLTITTTGLNSVAPTPGPLIDAARAVE